MPPPHPRKSVNNPTMGRVNTYTGHNTRSAEKISVLLSLLLFTTTTAITFLLQPPIMVIATRSLQVKEKPIGRMLASIAPSPDEQHQEQCSTRLSKSPRTTSVNPLIAELNQTRSRFDNALETLRPPTTHTMNNPPEEEDPGNMNLPPDKANCVSPTKNHRQASTYRHPTSETTPLHRPRSVSVKQRSQSSQTSHQLYPTHPPEERLPQPNQPPDNPYSNQHCTG
jgi:hypothetical protein